MTATQATAEVFWTAFKVLPAEEKRAVLQKIILDENLRLVAGPVPVFCYNSPHRTNYL